MWFKPDALSKNKTAPLANSANSANYDPESVESSREISKLAELADPSISKLYFEFLITRHDGTQFYSSTIPFSTMAEMQILFKDAKAIEPVTGAGQDSKSERLPILPMKPQ